jgi:hypothetical protein
MSELCSFYCLSFNNPERKQQMESRFEKLNINCDFHNGVSFDDIRMKNNQSCVWSNMFGHLDMIHNFYHNSPNEFGIFCENDVFIHKDLVNNLSKIIEDFKLLNLDVLLLGYLINFDVNHNYHNFHFKSEDNNLNFKYYNYPNELWGAQMYMLSKNQAKYLIDKYTVEFANLTMDSNNILTPFSPDWTITKDGNRAIIYPMMAVETSDKPEDYFHHSCKNHNYNADLFI